MTHIETIKEKKKANTNITPDHKLLTKTRVLPTNVKKK